MSVDAELRHRRIIEALLTSATATEAATRCGMSERTVRRHLADPAFRQAYADASRHHLALAAGTLRATASEAVRTLREAMVHGDSWGVRVRAASELLRHAIAVDLDDLADRVAALEADHRSDDHAHA